jgi:hypothetical protein
MEVERIFQRKDPNLNFCPVRKDSTIDLIIIILAQTKLNRNHTTQLLFVESYLLLLAFQLVF